MDSTLKRSGQNARAKRPNLRRLLRRKEKALTPTGAPKSWVWAERTAFRYGHIVQPILVLLGLVTAFTVGLFIGLPRAMQPLAGIGFATEQIAVLAMFVALCALVFRGCKILLFNVLVSGRDRVSRLLAIAISCGLGFGACYWYLGPFGILGVIYSAAMFGFFASLVLLTQENTKAQETVQQSGLIESGRLYISHFKDSVASDQILSFSPYRLPALAALILFMAFCIGLARMNYLESSGLAEISLVSGDPIEGSILHASPTGFLVHLGDQKYTFVATQNVRSVSPK